MPVDHNEEAARHAETVRRLTRRPSRAAAPDDETRRIVRFHEAAAALHAYHAATRKAAS